MQPPDKTINEAGEWKNASPRQIFALLIGIDKYLHCDDNIIKNLSGCNNDVDDVTDFLRTTLHVPDSNITQLRDEGATFAGITEALEGLANDVRITKGDAIVFFYAGHGTEVWPPGGMKFGRKKVHLLAPHDFSIDLTKVSPGAKQPEYGEGCGDMLANALKNGLRDIDLGQRLKKIADAKGDNITVILDCSHSARGTRDFATSSVSPRGIDLPEGPRQSHNAYVRHPRSQTPDDEENTGLTSHTLLAAASPSQHAHESANKAGLMRGVFTSHLTELLRSWHDLAQITYVDIILNLPSLPRQIPRCEGLNKYRVFLQDYLAGSQPSPIDLTYNTSTSRYILHAGDTHGVTVGTKLTVYDASSCKNELGQVVVEEVQSIQSFIHAPDFQIPSTGAFVLWTPVRSLRVFLHPGHKIDTDFLRLFENETSAWKLSLILVDKRESSDLVISTSNRGTPCFELIDQACVAEGFHKIHDKLIPMMDEMIMRIILCGIIHFLGYLHLKPTLSHRIAAANKVEVECFELIRVSVQLNFLHLMKVPRGCNLIEDGKMTVINPSREMYGFRITNTTSTPLFVSIFYFDMSDLSITTYYEPPFPGSVPCLPPGDILTVGYGTSGTPASSYFVPDGQSLDVGHVKLFLSTEYVDYHEVAQGSPFGYTHHIPVPKTIDCCWFTLDIPIIMRRE